MHVYACKQAAETMYDPIFAKSFTQYERKRFGYCALSLSFLIALSICSSFKPHLTHLSMIGGAVNVEYLSVDAVQGTLMRETSEADQPTAVDSVENVELPITAAQDPVLLVNATNSANRSRSKEIATHDEVIKRPLCRILEAHADYCEMEGDVRIDANSSTVFVVTHRQHSESETVNINDSSWRIQPYPRKGIAHVKNWTVAVVLSDDDDSNSSSSRSSNIPKCSQSHDSPALLFSIGGYSGNHFHDFADLLLPLYTTSVHFNKQVHFLASDFKPWWPSKFRSLLNRLTGHELVDIDRDKRVHCYSKMIAGLKFHRELVIDPALSSATSPNPIAMSHFRQFLRQTYALERTNAIKLSKKKGRRSSSSPSPRLMIISRKRTRILKNDDQVSRVARKLGYEVVSAEAEASTNLTRFAQLVNSCDVLMGIHGAGLTNMVFLPDDAVLIQVVPLGGIDGFARLDFGNPAPAMNIRYLEYKIKPEESSLSQQYPIDDPRIRDPLSFHRNGWDQLRSIYLDNQNVTIDIHRFRGTLVKALKLLRR